jgi:hypothetical protein
MASTVCESPSSNHFTVRVTGTPPAVVPASTPSTLMVAPSGSVVMLSVRVVPQPDNITAIEATANETIQVQDLKRLVSCLE